MCRACGPAPSLPAWFDAGLLSDLGSRMRARAVVLRVADLLGDPRIAVVTEQPGSPGVVVRSSDGRSRATNDLGSVWTLVTELTGRSIDPLGHCGSGHS